MTQGSTVAWFVNRPVDMGDGGLAAYLKAGEWVSPAPAQHRRHLEEMRPGDPIALVLLLGRGMAGDGLL